MNFNRSRARRVPPSDVDPTREESISLVSENSLPFSEYSARMYEEKSKVKSVVHLL